MLAGISILEIMEASVILLFDYAPIGRETATTSYVLSKMSCDKCLQTLSRDTHEHGHMYPLTTHHNCFTQLTVCKGKYVQLSSSKATQSVYSTVALSQRAPDL